MREFAQSVIILWGWRRLLAAWLAGAACVLALAPFHLAPLLWIALPVLVWLVDGIGEEAGRHRRRAARDLAAAAAIGWAFGFGYFLAGLHWVGKAFLVEADMFGWLMPFAVLGLPAGLALFTALGVALAYLFWSAGFGRIFALATFLTAAEWLRGHVLTGFPWNAFGQTLAFADHPMQAASLFGLYGLTFLAVLVFAAPAVLGTGPAPGARLPAWVAPLAVVAILPGLIGYGVWRLPAGPVAEVPGARLRIVQPNVPQDEKWRHENRSRIFADYLALSDRATSPTVSGVADVTHLVWPESALPFILSERADALAAIAALLPAGTHLLTGAVRRAEAGSTRAYNSIHLIDAGGRIVATYDKTHLVPFGEYLPLQELLERLGLEQLTRLRGGFEAGSGRISLAIPGLPPASPLICYEIIFPDAAVDRTARPGWMLNVTNDAWFGDSTGPRQHLHQARLRAVEEGLPVIRAANTGISAVIDPYGRLVRTLALGERGVIDTGLPSALPPTVYSRHGRVILFAFLVLGLAMALGGRLADERATTRRRTRPA